MIEAWPLIAFITLAFVIGVANDLAARKVKNQLVILFAIISICLVFLLKGWSAMGPALLAFCLAGGMLLPLFAAGVLGAGDVKLTMALALAMGVSSVTETVILSFVWGAVLGIMVALFHGRLGQLLLATARLALRQQVAEAGLHRVPFTVALLLGWLSHLSYGLRGGLL